MKCEACGFGYEGRFCPRCGRPNYEQQTSLVECRKCGAINHRREGRCISCNAPLGAASAADRRRGAVRDRAQARSARPIPGGEGPSQKGRTEAPPADLSELFGRLKTAQGGAAARPGRRLPLIGGALLALLLVNLVPRFSAHNASGLLWLLLMLYVGLSSFFKNRRQG
ncbi:MAG: hypothetical protein GXX99_01165 [Clostridiales bacterium]|nr:hypothetical protein [Clostridiales bacterium]